MSTAADVQSAAELERRRLANQAAQARASLESQAQESQAATEAQARRAIAETERQAQAARSQVEREASSRQADIRKQRGKAEREAEAAKGRARQARNIEQRKIALPYSKPQSLGTRSYIANVEVARRAAQRSGEDAKAAVTKVRDNYFRQVDNARTSAIADIKRQKAGIVRDIQAQLVNFEADITKQLAQANSGVSEWETEANKAIANAQAEYEAAMQAELNRPGTEVFKDMQSQGLVPADAVYQSYDKTTGQLGYTIPDTRTGEEIFSAEQASGNIPSNATYQSYNNATGELKYKVPKINKPAETTTVTTQPVQPAPTGSTQPEVHLYVNPVRAALGQRAGGIMAASAGAITLAEAGATTAAVPTPPTWAIGGILLVAALVVGIVERDRIVDNVNRILGKNQDAAQQASQSSSAVVTNDAGTVAYDIRNFTLTKEARGGQSLTFPYAPQAKASGPDIKDVQMPKLPGFTLTNQGLELKGNPTIRNAPDIIIRDPFDVPELKQKTSNILQAAAGLQAAAENFVNKGRAGQKTIPMTREQWQVVEQALRQGRVAEGRRIIEQVAKQKGDVTIKESLDAAYREYLRKKAILDAARKAYVASLNPQPIKGRGSSDAKAAAVGLWIAQDIMQAAIIKALAKGESTKSALQEAHEQVQKASRELGLTQQQVNAASLTVVQQLAVESMTQQAINTASLGQTQGLTATALETKTFAATKQAGQTIVQEAVQTKTIMNSQANEMTKALTQEAEAVTNTTLRIKLPKPDVNQNEASQKGKYPDGTIVWNQGKLGRKGDEYKIIPPPYNMRKPITSFKAPKGMRRTKGTPQQTLTFIGGEVPFENVSFDLGVTDGFIDVKAKRITFTGQGEKTNVGTRISETTKGVALTHNPPLLHQLVGGRRGRSRSNQRDKVKLTPGVSMRQTHKRGRLASHGVYTDKTGGVLTRHHRRGWKRIY